MNKIIINRANIRLEVIYIYIYIFLSKMSADRRDFDERNMCLFDKR